MKLIVKKFIKLYFIVDGYNSNLAELMVQGYTLLNYEKNNRLQRYT